MWFNILMYNYHTLRNSQNKSFMCSNGRTKSERISPCSWQCKGRRHIASHGVASASRKLPLGWRVCCSLFWLGSSLPSNVQRPRRPRYCSALNFVYAIVIQDFNTHVLGISELVCLPNIFPLPWPAWLGLWRALFRQCFVRLSLWKPPSTLTSYI